MTYLWYHIMLQIFFDDIDDSYWLWNELTMQIVNSHAPIKYKTIKGKRVPYMNGELRKAINVRNMLKRKFDKYKNTENWIKYRNHRNLVTRLKPQSHQIVRFVDRTIGCDLVSYDRSAMFAAISFYDRTLWFILYDWL